MDHGERDRVWPVVHLAIKDVFIVDDDSEAEEDPDGYIEVGKEDFFEDALVDRGR